MTTTEALISELEERAQTDGTWMLTSDELSDRYDAVDFYRAQYESAQVSTDSYGPDNVGELLVLLDSLTGRDYRAAFRAAGLLLTHDDRMELTERFVRVVRHAVVLHVPEPETFRAMLREFRRFDVAEFTYLATYFDSDRLVDRCTEEYLDLRSAPALRATVRSYLFLLLQRHVVDLHDLAPALMEILRTVARHEGMLPGGRGEDGAGDESGARARAGAGATGGPGAAEGRLDRREALRVLGLSVEHPSRDAIRDHYRRLMRRYHPDVNPNGLEMAKRINNAYAILTTSEGRS